MDNKRTSGKGFKTTLLISSLCIGAVIPFAINRTLVDLENKVREAKDATQSNNSGESASLHIADGTFASRLALGEEGNADNLDSLALLAFQLDETTYSRGGGSFIGAEKRHILTAKHVIPPDYETLNFSFALGPDFIGSIEQQDEWLKNPSDQLIEDIEVHPYLDLALITLREPAKIDDYLEISERAEIGDKIQINTIYNGVIVPEKATIDSMASSLPRESANKDTESYFSTYSDSIVFTLHGEFHYGCKIHYGDSGLPVFGPEGKIAGLSVMIDPVRLEQNEFLYNFVFMGCREYYLNATRPEVKEWLDEAMNNVLED